MKKELELLSSVVETRDNKALIQKYKKYVTALPTDESGEELYCVCRRQDDGRLMVLCDGCDNWFHFKCMGLDSKYERLVSNYYCVFCDELFRRGKTLWKKKCRLEGCMNAIRIDAESGKVSKYCSNEHGERFIRDVVYARLNSGNGNDNDSAISRQELGQVLAHVGDYHQFAELGSQLPRENLEKLPQTTRDKIQTAEAHVRELEESRKTLKLELTKLNWVKERSKIFNEEIFKLVNASSNPDDTADSSKKAKKTKKRKKDICGYFFGDVDSVLKLLNPEEEIKPIIRLQDLQISEQEFGEEFAKEVRDDSGAIVVKTRLFDTCIKDKSKCMKHSYWYEIKYDNIQNELLENSTRSQELQLEITDLISLGWEILEQGI